MPQVKQRDIPKSEACPACTHRGSLFVITSWDTVLPNEFIRKTDYVGCLDCGFAFYFGWTESITGEIIAHLETHE